MTSLSKNGKPIGRPPGSKNKKTLLKESVAGDLQKATKLGLDLMATSLPEVADVVVKQAKRGCRVSQSLIFKHILGDREKVGAKVPNITINVGGTNGRIAHEDEHVPGTTYQSIGEPEPGEGETHQFPAPGGSGERVTIRATRRVEAEEGLADA